MYPVGGQPALPLQFQLGPTEILLLIIIALILFGPKKLPELAKAAGEAVRIFREESQKITSSVEEAAAPKTAASTISDEDLKKLAEKLGVKTEGKSREELVEEVIKRAKEKGLI
ncbi:twin-arginine translocase TatA/TatE family subunit [Infirmifilum lucidum]|uniref:Sec-independent protein translocase protein TatA n=1 Tax=Infirmifilum lucidum TaxID=2776706 RepID=A0A7L9FJJ3_9CREN|nr:twin-arginine translocase TatA/TatE family subunit [Infirmifilum lucidum]QOJ79522.1 twin-arginine translocase TatA/TatE family subunit [Infirmifilum lucidum]